MNCWEFSSPGKLIFNYHHPLVPCFHSANELEFLCLSEAIADDAMIAEPEAVIVIPYVLCVHILMVTQKLTLLPPRGNIFADRMIGFFFRFSSAYLVFYIAELRIN